jgi:hypothetical protein
MRAAPLSVAGLVLLTAASWLLAPPPAAVHSLVSANAKPAPTPAPAPRAVPLEVTGDTAIVVKSFSTPVLVKAAAKDKTVYVWKYPDSFKADPASGAFSLTNVLAVSSAPKGSHKVSVSSLTTAKDGGWSIDSGEVTVHVGDLPSPGPNPGPDPGPNPDSPLTKLLRQALAAETDAAKVAQAKALAAVYEIGAAQVKDGKAKTVGALDKAMEAGAIAGGVSKKLPFVQGAISLHFKDKGLPFGKQSSLPIDDSNRDKIMGALSEVALSLKEVSP